MEDELKLFDKLENCSEIQADDIKRGDHFLYTSTKFKEDGRKCVYAVCYGASKGKLTCNTYVPKGEEKALEDWVLTITDKFKQYRFYKRNESVKPVKTPKPVKPKGTQPVKPVKPIKPVEPIVEPKEDEPVEHFEEETDYKGAYPKEEVFEKPKRKRILKK